MACTDLAEIEAQIEDGHSELKRLHERHREARVRRNQIHSRFPPEILAYIFSLTFPPRDKSPCCNPEKRAIPLNITSVCHSWRVLALSTPSLWCDISVDAENPNFQLLNHQVAHSGMVPLSIHLFTSSDCLSMDDDSGPKRAMSWAIKQIHRTASFYLGLPINSMTIFNSIPDSDYLKAAPLLEELHVHGTTPAMWSRLRLAMEPPRPRHVLLDSVSYFRIYLDWANICSLEMHSCWAPLPPDPLASKHLKQLVSLPWLCFSQFATEEALVVNTSIQNLTLGRFSESMFRRTTLPSLQKLEICFEDMTAICASLCDFLHRSQCPLQVLSIYNPFASDDGGEGIQSIIRVLENTDLLNRLTLRLEVEFLSPSFEPLIRRLSSRSRGFLPCLQTLSLQMQLLPPIDLLLDVVETDDNSSELFDDPSTILPLQKLILELPIFLKPEGTISRDDVLRILQLRAAGKTISICCSRSEATFDLVEYWKNVYEEIDQ